MKRIFLLTILVSLLLGGASFAQYSTFVVDDDVSPTTYPTLAAAIATAQTFAGGPHKIVIMAGAYSDHSLSVYDPTKIDEIYGDPAAAPGDIVFTQPAGPAKNFLTGWNGLVTLKNFKLVGYGGTAILANSAVGLTIEDVIIRGASGTGIDLSGTTGAVVDGLAFSKLTTGVGGTTVGTAVVKNSTFDSCYYAIDVTDFDAGSLEFLTISDGTWGIVMRAGSFNNFIKNSLVYGSSQEGITLQGSDAVYIRDNEVRGCTSYAVSLDATSGVIGPNWVKYNCFVLNRAAGASQGFDNAAGQNLWDYNYYSDYNFTMDGAAAEVDVNPKLYTLTATAPAASYNIDDVFEVDFNWAMPACSGLDSVRTAAFGFTVTFDPTKLQYVPMAAYDETLLGPGPEALYTAIDDATPGQLTFAAANFTTPGVNGARLAHAQFKVIGANTGVTIGFAGVDFRDPANNAMNYYVGSLPLTLVDNVAPVLVSYTQNNPAGDDTYSDGSVAGPGPFMKLMTTISATDNYALAMVEYSYDGAAFGNWYGISGIAYTDPTPQYAGGVAGLSEAPHTLALRVRDAGGLVSNVITYSFDIDRTGPVITSVTLKDADDCAVNVNYTNAVGILVDMNDDGTASLMEMVQMPSPPAFTDIGVGYADPANFTLTGADGSKTVHVQLWDKYNNLGASASDAITLDRVAPVPSAWVLGSGNPAKTSVPGINGYYGSLGSGAAQLAYSENVGDLVCGAALWQATGSPVAVTLSAGDGVKTVFFATRDNAGNISTPLSDQIELDQTAPVLTAYNMVDRTTFSSDCSNNGLIRAYYSYTGTDAVDLQWSYDGLSWGSWKVPSPSPDSADGSVPASPDGWKLLYIRLVDDILNVSNVMIDSIYVDGTAPTLATVTPVDIAATANPDPVWPSVTNSTTFKIQLTGLSADVVALKISEDGVTYADYPVSTGGAANFDYIYTWSVAPTQCSWMNVYVKTVDCAGNTSGAVSGGVYFDLAVPTIASFTGPAMTNNPVVSLTISAADNCSLYRMRLGEGSLNGVAWVAFNANPSFTLSSGDGNKIVNLEVSDYGGNLAASSVTIKLDQTVPTAGTFVIVSANPLAAPQYTDNLAGNIANIAWDADVVQMYIRNSDGTGGTGWIAVASPHALAPLAGVPAIGVQTVQYRFRDGANNVGPVSGWYTATIDYSNAAPPAPLAGSAIGIPSGSCDLTWGSVSVAQSYLIRYNFQNQYPTYPDPIPPHPATFAEGILAAEGVVDTTYHFGGPQPDIYSFSIWTLGKNGMWSTGPNVDVTATNYLLGDFSPAPDGCIKFTAEFGALAVSYNSVFGAPNFNDSLDIAPTLGADPWGYPMPDLKIDFEDLVIFALNYDDYHCTSPVDGQPGNERQQQTVSASAIAVEAVVPSRVKEGDEFTIPVTADNYQAVKGYHVVLGYNSNNFELVKVEAGEGYKSVAESFFYYDQKSANIDVSGVVLGSGVTFGSEELFRVTLRARSTSEVNLEEVQLTFRDRTNSDLIASLGVVKTTVLPTEFALSQNYPNPFNPTTTVELSLPVASNYKLTIYNVLGQTVEAFEGHSEAGYKTITWNAGHMASGIYLYRVEAGSYTATRKMVLLK